MADESTTTALDAPALVKPRRWRPSQPQVAVLEAAMEGGPKRTIRDICRAAKVHHSSFYEWLRKDPGFQYAWEHLWERAIERHYPAVVGAMVHKAVVRGDVGAARLISELKGALKQRIEVTGRGGGPVQTLNLSALNSDQLAALMSLAPSAVAPQGVQAEPPAQLEEPGAEPSALSDDPDA